jgi:hypothetical protein
MGDLKNPGWMILKTILFIGIGLISSSLILLELPHLRIAALLVLAIWAFARAYYFAGLFSVARYFLARPRR